MQSVIFKPYWLVTTLRESPANTVYSWFILMLTMIIFILLVALQWWLIVVRKPVTFAVAMSAVSLLLVSYAVYTYFVLYLTKKTSRFLQTFTCLLMAYLMIHLCAMPLVWLNYALLNKQISMAVLFYINTLYLTLTLGLTIWQFLAMAHIYHQALDIDFPKGILVSLGLMAFNFLTFSLWR